MVLQQVFLMKQTSHTDTLELNHFKLFCMGIYEPDTTDTDGDGLYDYIEEVLHTDMHSPDSDFDGLNDYNEVYLLGTNPMQSDTDNDTLSDYMEVRLNLNPLAADSDYNGIPDNEEYIPQKYQYDIEDNELLCNFSIDMNTKYFLENDMFILQEEYTEHGSLGVVIGVESDAVYEGESGAVSFSYNKNAFVDSPENLIIFGYRNDTFIPLETNVDEINRVLSTESDKLCLAYYVGTSETEKDIPCQKLSHLAKKAKPKYSKSNLISDMEKNFSKDTSISKKNPRQMSVKQAINIVLKYPIMETCLMEKIIWI